MNFDCAAHSAKIRHSLIHHKLIGMTTVKGLFENSMSNCFTKFNNFVFELEFIEFLHLNNFYLKSSWQSSWDLILNIF
jgi:hypothetical protein